ncbi:MAG: hypothetical protein QOH88_3620 [Verrucomicrobiota bacterium]
MLKRGNVIAPHSAMFVQTKASGERKIRKDQTLALLKLLDKAYDVVGTPIDFWISRPFLFRVPIPSGVAPFLHQLVHEADPAPLFKVPDGEIEPAFALNSRRRKIDAFVKLPSASLVEPCVEARCYLCYEQTFEPRG